MPKIDTDLRILEFDIETSPALSWHYGLFDQNISIKSVVQQPRMIAFSAKWYGKKPVKFFSEYHHSRKTMLEEMHTLLDEADVVTGWNSRRFDTKWVNSELVVEGFTPPSPYKQLDLLTETKRSFRFLSYKLDYVAERLLDDKKIDYNMLEMWVKVSNPETSEADRRREWDAMARYAKKDTALMEPLLEELLPWIKMPHPVKNQDDPDVPLCHNCGSKNVHRRGRARTLTGSYARYQCECGSWLRGTTRENASTVRAL